MASRKVIKFSVCLMFLAFCSNSLECDDVEMLMTDFDLLMDRFSSRFWYPALDASLFSLLRPRLLLASVFPVVQEPLSDISIVTCRRRLSSMITSLIEKLLDSTKCSRLSISSTLKNGIQNKAKITVYFLYQILMQFLCS